jgi:Flp pilus assembly pilin Flp
MLNGFYKLLAKYVAETDGVTGLEYGLIAGGIGLTAATAIVVVGDSLDGMMATFGDFLSPEQEL